MTTVFKNIPLPSTSDGGIISEPLRALGAVGDMVFVPVGGNAKTRRAGIYSTAERLGIKVMVSTKRVENVPPQPEPSFAVWRLE